MSNHNQQRSPAAAAALAAMNTGTTAQVIDDQPSNTTDDLSIDYDMEECTTGFDALSMTEKVLAGVGIGVAAGAAGYGAAKGTALLIGTEALAAEGAMAAGLLGGVTVAGAAPFVIGGLAIAGVAYGGKKAVDYLARNRTTVLRRVPAKPVAVTQSNGTSSAAEWPLPAASQNAG